MIEHDLIDPIIFFKPGQCPYCSGILMVVDSEISCMLLGSDGMPIKEETRIRCIGTCQSCGKSLPMMKYKYGYVRESKSFWLFKNFDKLQERKLSQIEVEGNPFITE